MIKLRWSKADNEVFAIRWKIPVIKKEMELIEMSSVFEYFTDLFLWIYLV